MKIRVDAYSGYKANERPLRFWNDDTPYEIVAIERQWHELDAACFRVRTADTSTYTLCYNESTDTWTLHNNA